MLYQVKRGEILVPLRVGDIPSGVSGYSGWMDGMCAGYVGDAPNGQGYYPVLSEFSLRRNRWVRITPEQRDAIISGQDEGVDANGVTIPTKLRIDLVQLAGLGLVDGSTAKDQRIALGPIDGRGVPVADIVQDLESKRVVPGTLLDSLAVAAGSYTVGSGGGDNYPTFGGASGFAADIAATLTGDLTGTMVSDITETATGQLNTATAGYSLLIDVDNWHGGDVTSSHRMATLNWNRDWIEIKTVTGLGSVTVRRTHSKRVIGSLSYYGHIRLLVNATVSTVNIVDNYCDGSGGNSHSGVLIATTSSDVNVHGNVCWECDNGIYINANSTKQIVENNTCYGCSNGVWGNNNDAVLRNNVSFGNTSAYNACGNVSTFSKCAADDATGSEAGLDNLTVSDQVQSTDDTSAVFMWPKTTGAIYGAGTTPTITTVYANGRTAVSTDMDIGALGLARMSNITITSGASGSTAGGTTMTLTNDSAGFVGSVSVTVGGSAATGESVLNTGTMTAVTPAGSAGAVDVVATNGDGVSATVSGGFTYVLPTTPSTSTDNLRKRQTLRWGGSHMMFSRRRIRKG